MSELPVQLRSALERSNKSASKLCNEVGISRTYWYRLINGEEEAIAEETLRKLEAALDVNFGVSFEGDR
ncbi:helix-turn-helix transcriptional regulator [Trichocoleus desertorum AS-A10]|uniref:helix-turn-helix domain-containing protein n=1 Tax=Trichocoleus desertorum TaxID=1481672 RepID=UPI0032991949